MKTCRTVILVFAAMVLINFVAMAEETFDFDTVNEPCHGPDWNDEKLQAACNLYCTLNDCDSTRYDATTVMDFLRKLSMGIVDVVTGPETIDDGGAFFKPNQPVYRGKVGAATEKQKQT